MEITLKNLSYGSELVLSEESFVYILDKVDWGSVQASHQLSQYMDLIGGEITATSLQARDIFIQGWVVANSEELMKERKSVLNKFIHPLHWMECIYGDYKLTFKPTSSVKYSSNYLENNEIVCKFLVSGECNQPLFMLASPDVVTKSVAQEVPFFPATFVEEGIVFGFIPAIDLENLVNYGDVSAGFVAKLVANGAVTKPVITNSTTGDLIELNIELLEEDILEVSTLLGDKYIKLTRAGATTDEFKALTKTSTLFELVAGVNSLVVTATTGDVNLEVEVTYSPRFLEVQ